MTLRRAALAKTGDDAMVRSVRETPSAPGAQSSLPVDVSGVWIWEHRGAIPTGDEKQEREEWHVDQDGDRLSGYYDRVVREISNDGHAFKCSMDMEFEIATRYKFRGEVRGNQLVIYETRTSSWSLSASTTASAAWTPTRAWPTATRSG